MGSISVWARYFFRVFLRSVDETLRTTLLTNYPVHFSGIYQCLYYGVGFGCGPIMAGVLFEHVGGANTFLVFSGISFALLLFSLGRHAITRHFYDNIDDQNYKPVPDEEDEEDTDQIIKEKADY